jgi:CRP-like cAMP-binding protein
MTYQFPNAHRLNFDDQVIFREGDKSETAFVIKTGEVETFITRDGVDTVLERLGPGDIVAENALLQSEVHGVSARAVGEVRLRAVVENKLDDLRDELGPRSWAIVSEMVMRVHATSGKLRQRVSSAAPAPAVVAA